MMFVLKMAYNVKRLCDGGEIEAEMLNLLLILLIKVQMFVLALKPHYCKTDVMRRFSS